MKSLSATDMTAASFPTTFVVAGTSDTTAPSLLSFAISTAAISAASGGAVVLTAHFNDDLSGLAGTGYSSSPTQVRFRSPSGRQFVDGLFMPNLNLVSGTALDGTYQGQLLVPRFAEQGTWIVEQFLLVDQVGNMRTLATDQMRAMGFPVAFTVGP